MAAPQPLERIGYLRRARPHDAFAVVAAPRLKKGAYCDEGGISCQFRALEDLPGADADAGIDDDIPGSGQLDRREMLTHTLRPGRKTLNKNRHIRPKPGAQPRELLKGEPGIPQAVESQESGSRIRAPATQAPALRDAFVDLEDGAMA